MTMQTAAESALMISVLSMEIPDETDLQALCDQAVLLGAMLVPGAAVDLSHNLLGGPLRVAATSDPAASAAAASPQPLAEPAAWAFTLSGSAKLHGYLRFLFDESRSADERKRELASAFAGHVALALDRAALRMKIEHLLTAVETNREIGAAVGVLMARHGLGYDDAFRLLRVESQRANRKLRLVASEVLYTGSLPQHADSTGSPTDAHR